MENLALSLGTQLFEKRYNRKPDVRIKELTIEAGEIKHLQAVNEIYMLYDVSKNDVDFQIKSGTYFITQGRYFKNRVPSRPYDLTGDIMLDCRSALDSLTFTFLVFY